MAKQKSHAPGFFRVLLPGFPKRLPLPAAFPEYIITERSSTKSTLVNPNGGSWSVEVHEENRLIYFEGDGWIEFVHAHNLMLGYFLIFTYRGDMVFDFRAYDLSTCEISYPSIDQIDKHETQKINTLKRKRVTVQETRKCPNSDTKGMDEKKSWKREVNKILSEKECCSLVSPTTSTSKGIRFAAVINPYNFSKPYVGVPAAVIKECSELKRTDWLTLKNPEGRLWQVKLFHRKYFRRGYSTHLSAGWTKFVRGNKLKLGDKCVFELQFKGEEKVVNVQIVRSVNNPS